MGKTMPLAEWLLTMESAKAAELIGIKDQTSIRQWRTYRNLPNAEKMKRIVEVSKGKVTYQSIIEPFLKFHGR